MKRSEINALIARAKGLFKEDGWILPPFADYAPERDLAGPSVAHGDV